MGFGKRWQVGVVALMCLGVTCMVSGCFSASTGTKLPPVLKGPPESIAKYIPEKDDWHRANYAIATTQLADVIRGSTSELDVLIQGFFNSSVKRGDPMPVVLVAPDGTKAMLVVDHNQGVLELFALELADGHWTALPVTRVEKK